MRWESLFADLEAQLDGVTVHDRAAEVQEMVRIEKSQVMLSARLVAWIGQSIDVTTLGGQRFSGEVTHVGTGWVTLAAAPLEYLVLTSAVRSLVADGARVAPDSDLRQTKISLRMALRAVARDRAPVTIYALDGSAAATGTLDYVGVDFLQIAAHSVGEYVSSSRVVARHVLPLSGIAALQRSV
ncbi:hypothetical protein [Zhihengliuella sp.]|uniref:hypothetical protein n=1 Tax=Zhihengliuella sp. TaxID=1954483 RepID=UPI0028126D8B|nr:hypothetical protein [Zhihengliuella sp.]